MNFIANKDKLQKPSYSFSSILDDGLTSLLSVPLPSLDMPSAASYDSSFFSFEKPFDDPRMEPVPLAPHTLGGDGYLPYNCSSNDVQFRKNLAGILDPVIDLVRSKRRLDDFNFDHGEEHQHDTKRQRTISAQPTALSEECTARFRPYQEQQWRTQFQKLIEFKLINGHCCVPHSYQEDPVLARWVKRQRYQYKKFNDKNPTSTMTTRRIEELESVGFVWHSHHAAWQEKLNELKAFKLQRGHCRVPSHYPENVALSTWVKCQRRQYKLYINGSTSNMTPGRVQALESLGFVFDVSKKS